ncbi:MAG: hypothetical protein ACKVZ6_14935 [Kineosporiaceae bacterium]
METARFQLVSGARTDGRLDPLWPVVTHRSSLEPADTSPGADSQTPWYGWRLLSRNHRDLARSPAVYPTIVDCLASVAVARDAVARAETVLARHGSTGRWTWHLETPERAVAAGSRGYMRRRECHDCVVQVVELVAVALDPEPRVVAALRNRRPVRP